MLANSFSEWNCTNLVLTLGYFQTIFAPRITSVQYCGDCSVLRGDSISTAEAVEYYGGIASVLWGDSISTTEE